MEATFVIIGGGIAGVSCIKTLSFLAPEEPAILITSTAHVKVVTNIVPVGKVAMQFDVEEQSSTNLSSLHPNLRIINETVIRIHPEEKIIETETGIIVKFKKICICTGARPRLIANSPFVIGIRDTESVDEFSRRIQRARRILVVGNGGIATEIVYKIENVDVVWAIKDRHVSATFVDPGAAEFFKPTIFRGSNESAEKLEKISTENNVGKFEENPNEKLNFHAPPRNPSSKIAGAALGPEWQKNFPLPSPFSSPRHISIEYECEVSKIISRVQDAWEIIKTSDNYEKSFSSICEAKNDDFSPPEGEDQNWPIFAELTNGKTIGCDFIISATGVIPNSEIPGLELAERAADGGLSVDWKLETNLKDIFAAGDVCSANWSLADHWMQMRLWTQAHQMGCSAAKSMVSILNNEDFLQDFCFELFTHVTKFFGYKVVLLGLYNGQKLDGNYEILLRMTRDEEYVKLVVKNGRLQGAVLIGETDLEEMCENLILNQLDISIYGEDLLNPDIDIEDYFD
uniref:Pyridine nucleotide-disulfide oxidoreductase domain-containing protein 1 n=1 Tax=Bracon brevicornis TaxID=1563983 RepID=A0A6V7IUH5_9HYME